MRTELGKIEHIKIGHGGYQDAMLGATFTLSGSGWGVQSFEGFWNGSIEVTEHTKWTEAQRIESYAKVLTLLDDLLTKAKKNDVQKLIGVPIEATFDGNTLQSWRILEEVI